MTLTEPGPGAHDSSSTTRTPAARRGGGFTGLKSKLAGAFEPGRLDLTARVGLICAGLCTLLFLAFMTYTLAHHRHWGYPAALLIALVFSALALLTAVPHVIRDGRSDAGVQPRLTMWATGAVLAVLQLVASVLGDAEFSMAAVIGITSVLAVPCFGELAAQSGGLAAPARGGAAARTPAGSEPAAPAAGTAAAPAAVAEPTTDVKPTAAGTPVPAAEPVTASDPVTQAIPTAAASAESPEPVAPTTAVTPASDESPVADPLRKDPLRKKDSPSEGDPLSKGDALSKEDPLRKKDALRKDETPSKGDALRKKDPLRKD